MSLFNLYPTVGEKVNTNFPNINLPNINLPNKLKNLPSISDKNKVKIVAFVCVVIVAALIAVSAFILLDSSPGPSSPPFNIDKQGDSSGYVSANCTDGEVSNKCLFNNNSQECRDGNCERKYTGLFDKIDRCNKQNCIPCSPGMDIENGICSDKNQNLECKNCLDGDNYFKCNNGYVLDIESRNTSPRCISIFRESYDSSTIGDSAEQLCDTGEINNFLTENKEIFNIGSKPYTITTNKQTNLLDHLSLNNDYPIEINYNTDSMIDNDQVDNTHIHSYSKNLFQSNRERLYQINCDENGNVYHNLTSSPEPNWEYYCKYGDLDNFKHKNGSPPNINLKLNKKDVDDYNEYNFFQNHIDMEWTNIFPEESSIGINNLSEFKSVYDCKNSGDVMVDKPHNTNENFISPFCGKHEFNTSFSNVGLNLPITCVDPNTIPIPSPPIGYEYIGERVKSPPSEITYSDTNEFIDLQYSIDDSMMQCSSPAGYVEKYENPLFYNITYERKYDKSLNEFIQFENSNGDKTDGKWDGCQLLQNCGDYYEYLGNNHKMNKIYYELRSSPCQNLEDCAEKCRNPIAQCDLFDCNSDVYKGRTTEETFYLNDDYFISKNKCCEQKTYREILNDIVCSNQSAIRKDGNLANALEKITDNYNEFKRKDNDHLSPTIPSLPDKFEDILGEEIDMKPSPNAINSLENLKRGSYFNLDENKSIFAPMCVPERIFFNENSDDYYNNTYTRNPSCEIELSEDTVRSRYGNQINPGYQLFKNKDLLNININDYLNNRYDICYDSGEDSENKYKCESKAKEECSSPCQYDKINNKCHSTIPIKGTTIFDITINNKTYKPVYIKNYTNSIKTEFGETYLFDTNEVYCSAINIPGVNRYNPECSNVMIKYKIGDQFYEKRMDYRYIDSCTDKVIYRSTIPDDRELDGWSETNDASDSTSFINTAPNVLINCDNNINENNNRNLKNKFIRVNKSLLKDNFDYCAGNKNGSDSQYFPINPPDNEKVRSQCNGINRDQCDNKPFCYWSPRNDGRCLPIDTATCLETKYGDLFEGSGYVKRNSNTVNVLRDYSNIGLGDIDLYDDKIYTNCEYISGKGYFEEYNEDIKKGIKKGMICEKNEFRSGITDMDNMVFNYSSSDIQNLPKIIDPETGESNYCESGYFLNNIPNDGGKISQKFPHRFYCEECPKTKIEDNFRNNYDQTCDINQTKLQDYSLLNWYNLSSPEKESYLKYRVSSPSLNERTYLCKTGYVYNKDSGKCDAPNCSYVGKIDNLIYINPDRMKEDLTGDGLVGTEDLLLILAEYGDSSSINPETQHLVDYLNDNLPEGKNDITQVNTNVLLDILRQYGRGNSREGKMYGAEQTNIVSGLIPSPPISTYIDNPKIEPNIGYYYNYPFDQLQNQQLFCSGNQTLLRDKCYETIISDNESRGITDKIIDYQPSIPPSFGEGDDICEHNADIGSYNRDKCIHQKDHIWVSDAPTKTSIFKNPDSGDRGYCVDVSNPLENETMNVLLENSFDPNIKVEEEGTTEIPEKFQNWLYENKNLVLNFINSQESFQNIEGIQNNATNEDIYDKLVDIFRNLRSQKVEDNLIANPYTLPEKDENGNRFIPNPNYYNSESSPYIFNLDGQNFIELKGNIKDYNNWVDDFKECGWEADLTNITASPIRDKFKNTLARKCNRLFYYGNEYDQSEYIDAENPKQEIPKFPPNKSSPIENTERRFEIQNPFYSFSKYMDEPSEENNFNKTVKSGKLPSFCSSNYDSENNKLYCGYNKFNLGDDENDYNISSPYLNKYKRENERIEIQNDYSSMGTERVTEEFNKSYPLFLSNYNFEASPGKIRAFGENDIWSPDGGWFKNENERYGLLDNTFTEPNKIKPIGICPGYLTRSDSIIDNVNLKMDKQYNTYDSDNFKLKNLSIPKNFNCISTKCYVNESNMIDPGDAILTKGVPTDSAAYLFNSSPANPNQEGCSFTKSKYGLTPPVPPTMNKQAEFYDDFLNEVLPWPIIRAQSYLSCGGGLDLDNLANGDPSTSFYNSDPPNILENNKKYMLEDTKEDKTCSKLNTEILNAWYYTIRLLDLVDPPNGLEYPEFTDVDDPNSVLNYNNDSQEIKFNYKIHYFESVICAKSWGGYDENNRYKFIWDNSDQPPDEYSDNISEDQLDFQLPGKWVFKIEDSADSDLTKKLWVLNRDKLKYNFEKNLKFISPTGFCKNKEDSSLVDELKNNINGDFNQLWWPLNGPNILPLPGDYKENVTRGELWQNSKNILTPFGDYDPFEPIKKKYKKIAENHPEELNKVKQYDYEFLDDNGIGIPGYDLRMHVDTEAEKKPTFTGSHWYTGWGLINMDESKGWGDPVNEDYLVMKSKMGDADYKNRIVMHDYSSDYTAGEYLYNTYKSRNTGSGKEGNTVTAKYVKNPSKWWEEYLSLYTSDKYGKFGEESYLIPYGSDERFLKPDDNTTISWDKHLSNKIKPADSRNFEGELKNTDSKYSCRSGDTKFQINNSGETEWDKNMELKNESDTLFNKLFPSNEENNDNFSDNNEYKWYSNMKPWLINKDSTPSPPYNNGIPIDITNETYIKDQYNQFPEGEDFVNVDQNYTTTVGMNDLGRSDISTIIRGRSSRYDFNCLKENKGDYKNIQDNYLNSDNKDLTKLGGKSGFSEIPLSNPEKCVRTYSKQENFKRFAPPGFMDDILKKYPFYKNTKVTEEIGKNRDAAEQSSDLVEETFSDNWWNELLSEKTYYLNRFGFNYLTPAVSHFSDLSMRGKRGVNSVDTESVDEYCDEDSMSNTPNNLFFDDYDRDWRNFLFENKSEINFDINSSTRNQKRKEWLNIDDNYYNPDKNDQTYSNKKYCNNPISYQACNYDEECEGLCIKGGDMGKIQQIQHWINPWAEGYGDWFLFEHNNETSPAIQNNTKGICQFGPGSKIRKLPNLPSETYLDNQIRETGGSGNIAWDHNMDKFCSINKIDYADSNPRLQSEPHKYAAGGEDFQSMDANPAAYQSNNALDNLIPGNKDNQKKNIGPLNVFKIANGPGEGQPCNSLDSDKRKFYREPDKKCLVKNNKYVKDDSK